MRNFTFFNGYDGWEPIAITPARIRAVWEPEPIDDLPTLDMVEELSRTLSEEIDNEIINELTRRINGGMRA